MTLLLIDNYDSFTYNLYQMLPDTVRVARNRDLSFNEILAGRFAGIILSPGPGNPTNPQDFGVCREVIERQAELDAPILGVCLGMQGIVAAFGGSVIPAPEILHGKTSPVRIVGSSPLLEGLPNLFTVMRYHSLAVGRDDLPGCLEVTAEVVGAFPVIMAIQHRTQPIYGVQFHPESVGTPEGARLLENFTALCRQPWAATLP